MSLLTAAATSKLAAAALGVLTVGGVGTAAATGSLPVPAQDLAHQLVGAPAPVVKDVKNTVNQSAAKAENTVNDKAVAAKDAVKKAVAGAEDKASGVAGKATDAAEKAADKAVSGTGAADIELLGLCKANASNTLDASSTGFKTLVLAAHDAGNIATFCANLAGQQVSVEGSTSGDATAKVNVPAAPQLPAVPGKIDVPSVPAVNVPALPKVAG